MAKAQNRTSAKKMKDKWRSKRWYKIVAPPMFESVGIGDTLSDEPEKLMDRTIVVTMDDLTGNFSKSHIKLQFRIVEVRDNIAYTKFIGHDVTSDYTRRLVRRKRSKLDGVFDVATKDGYVIRVKPLAVSEKRIQASQQRQIRSIMKEHITEMASKVTIGDFVKMMINDSISKELFGKCKPIYPLKRIEICKSEIKTKFEEFEDSEIIGHSPAKADETPAEELSPEDARAKAIKEFTSLPGVGKSKAEALYDGGVISMEALKAIPTEELARVDKVSDALAQKIKAYLNEQG